MKKLFTVLLAVIFLSIPAFAIIIHVPGDQPTIQAGIDAADDGDTVLVADGTYTGTGNKNIDFTGKAIVVISENGSETCIIDCEDDGRGFIFETDETASSLLSGFTVTNGYVSYDGGGIFCDESSPTIINCTLSGNTAAWGGGIGCRSSSDPTIENCTLSGNSAYYNGGGINCYGSSIPIIKNCTIIGNSVVSHGGGIYCGWGSNPSIINSTISGNSTGWDGGGIFSFDSNPTIITCNITGNSSTNVGGGITVYGSSPTIESCIITGNSASDDGGGIHCGSGTTVNIRNCTISGNSTNDSGGGININSSIPIILNNIVECNTGNGGIYFNYSANTSVLYSDFHNNQNGNFTGNSIPSNLGVITSVNANGDSCDQFFNIFLDPLFYSITGDSAYYLTVNSPCIDAGNPDPQYNDPEDPANPGFALYPAMGTIRNDMGAYGGQGAAGWVGVFNRHFSEQHLKSYSLFQNYPNPFNPETNIAFELPKPGEVSLVIYDIQGKEVARLVDEYKPAGSHSITWNAEGFTSGIYFARLTAGNFTQTQKLLLIK